MIQQVPITAFQGVEHVESGMQFQASTEQGPLLVTVVDVEDDTVIVDGNHPLAGQALNFDVTIDSVREATEEELAHGHVHGVGGVQH